MEQKAARLTLLAGRMPEKDSGSLGARNRLSPTGGAAYRMPSHWVRPFGSGTPAYLPVDTATTGHTAAARKASTAMRMTATASMIARRTTAITLFRSQKGRLRMLDHIGSAGRFFSLSWRTTLSPCATGGVDCPSRQRESGDRSRACCSCAPFAVSDSSSPRCRVLKIAGPLSEGFHYCLCCFVSLLRPRAAAAGRAMAGQDPCWYCAFALPHAPLHR